MNVDTVIPPTKVSASGTRITQAEKLSLAGILVLFLLPAIHAARLRPFRFDELSTLFLTSTPTLRAMFHAIPTDGNPHLYVLLARPPATPSDQARTGAAPPRHPRLSALRHSLFIGS
jgi:hypothetical protein